MLEFVQALHEAFHTDSRWLFVLYIGLTFAVALGLLAAGLAYVVDSGYQRKLREQKTITPPAPLVIRDDAEEQRLRDENAHLKQELNERNERQRTIQARLGEFISQGIDVRDEWSKRLGSTSEIQRGFANNTKIWHERVEDYLKTIPRGNLYLAKFRNRPASTGSYPIGINLDVAGWWDILTSDLARLSEFLDDPNLGHT